MCVKLQRNDSRFDRSIRPILWIGPAHCSHLFCRIHSRCCRMEQTIEKRSQVCCCCCFEACQNNNNNTTLSDARCPACSLHLKKSDRCASSHRCWWAILSELSVQKRNFCAATSCEWIGKPAENEWLGRHGPTCSLAENVTLKTPTIGYFSIQSVRQPLSAPYFRLHTVQMAQILPRTRTWLLSQSPASSKVYFSDLSRFGWNATRQRSTLRSTR